MKHSITLAGLLFATLSATSVDAEDGGLARCAQIASPVDRLACFDALAEALEPDVLNAATAQTPPPPPAAAVVATQDPVPAPNPEASFGFENKALKSGNKEMVARYVGEFSGWSGGTLFKLDNGQVWKQAQSGRVYHRRDNPVITIRKGALGSFRLSVEGTKRSVRVKRVK